MARSLVASPSSLLATSCSNNPELSRPTVAVPRVTRAVSELPACERRDRRRCLCLRGQANSTARPLGRACELRPTSAVTSTTFFGSTNGTASTDFSVGGSRLRHVSKDTEGPMVHAEPSVERFDDNGPDFPPRGRPIAHGSTALRIDPPGTDSCHHLDWRCGGSSRPLAKPQIPERICTFHRQCSIRP